MQRFYFPEIRTEELTLNSPDILHQITKVMRSQQGDHIIFFDGKDDNDFVYEIRKIDKRSITLQQIKKIEKNGKQKREIILYQSIPNKQDKIEWILQKGVEVGISKFIFFRAKRSQKFGLTDAKIERFKKILIEAVEQSGRNDIPNLDFFDTIDIEKIEGEKLIFHTLGDDAKKLDELELSSKKINIFVGPEGGWDNEEIKQMEKTRVTKVYLGKNILRTETCGIVVGFWLGQNGI